MKIYYLTIVFIFGGQLCFSQFDSLKQSEVVFTSGCLEIPPKYPGGQDAIIKLFTDSMNYPAQSEKQGIGGKVIIQYTVDTLGNTVNMKVYKGVCDDLNQEAIRLISLLKNWIPATQNGKKINSVDRLQPFYFIADKVNIKKRRLTKNKTSR